ncbi:MAG: plasmid pRiA4b ORF-3 family protein [Betaproteobacteria bacterium]|nr:MAG: plasmid pRiA4b ORF-3 family protein [Betaproteobacteria bacterium]
MPTAYHLKIELRHLKPAIFREVLVAPDIKLSKLHDIIQAAMGWDDAHLHGFALLVGKESFYAVPPERRFEPASHDPMDFGRPVGDESRTRLSDLLLAPKQKLAYNYDFGDDWEHLITLKAIVETEAALPTLIKAQHACPPEDCGGPPGFLDLAEAWHLPDHEMHEYAREVFDDNGPGWFDVERLAKDVARLQPKARAGAKAKVWVKTTAKPLI